jgi:predicted RNA-binding Zn-ribbon protein involved in translation (DUF1610 family)
MSDKIALAVASGCPKCGHDEIALPEELQEETVIACDKCGHTAPHLVFFKAGEE